MNTFWAATRQEMASVSGGTIASEPTVLLGDGLILQERGLDELNIGDVTDFAYNQGAPEGSLDTLGILLTDSLRPLTPIAPRHGSGIVAPHQEYNGVHYGPFIALGVGPKPDPNRMSFFLRHEIGHMFQSGKEYKHTGVILGGIAVGVVTEAVGLVSVLSSAGESQGRVSVGAIAVTGVTYATMQASSRALHRLQPRERDATRFARATADFNPIRAYPAQ